nr:alpha/beta fold hydrolase [Caldilineaceae bacterium]
GGPVGVLLVHGFTGSPTEMRLVGEYLNQRGITVSAPCLPGHATTLDDLNRRRWSDWSSHITQKAADLRSRCDTVFVGGLSLGALLSLYLAANLPGLAGAILYSPAIMLTDPRRHLLPVLKYLVRQLPKPADNFVDPEAGSRLWSYNAFPVAASYEVIKLIGQVERHLPRVTCPLLVVQSTADDSIHPDCAQFVYERVGAAEKEIVTLHHSGHVLTLDQEWEQVAEQTYQFIRKQI